MMKYPAECPVFEMIDSGPFCRAGAVLEAIGIGVGFGACSGIRFDGALWLRFLDEADCIDGDYLKSCLSRYEFLGMAARASAVRPLTPAAREMLKLVRVR